MKDDNKYLGLYDPENKSSKIDDVENLSYSYKQQIKNENHNKNKYKKIEYKSSSASNKRNNKKYYKKHKNNSTHIYNVEIITKHYFSFKRFPDFKQVSARKYVAKNLTLQQAKKYRLKALLWGYHAYYFANRYERNKDYRSILDEYEGDYCRCVYCGRKFPKQSITVDHIISVAYLKKSPLARYILDKWGFKDINDRRNLVPACYYCNDRKKDHFSIGWIIKARLGSHLTYWVTIRVLCVVFAVVVIILFLTKGIKLYEQ